MPLEIANFGVFGRGEPPSHPEIFERSSVVENDADDLAGRHRVYVVIDIPRDDRYRIISERKASAITTYRPKGNSVSSGIADVARSGSSNYASQQQILTTYQNFKPYPPLPNELSRLGLYADYSCRDERSKGSETFAQQLNDHARAFDLKGEYELKLNNLNVYGV